MKKAILHPMLAALLCFWSIAAQAQDPHLAWARAMGGPCMEEAHSLAVDHDGNVYTTGWYNGPSTFGSSPAFPGPGMFVTKFDAGGNYVWAKTLGNSVNERGRDIKVDRDGNVYITGFFQGTVDFDPGPGTHYLNSAGADDIFALKLDTDGNFMWANRAGGSSPYEEFGLGIALDTARNAYICGFFAGTADFDTINLSVAGGNLDAFVAKLDTGGHFAWAKVIGGPDIANNRAWGIGVDGASNVYVTGGFAGTIGLGSLSLTSTGSVDIFVTKLNTNGNFIWAKNMGGTSLDFGNKLVVDAAGNIYSTGYYYTGAADFDPGPGVETLTAQGSGSDIYISKLDTDGNFVWVNRIGGRQSEGGGWGIDVDPYGNVFLASRIRDTVITYNASRDTIPNVSTHGGYDILLAKLDASGHFMWVTNIGAPGPGVGTDEAAYGIVVGPSGSIYATGVFNGDQVDFDPSSLPADTAFLSSGGDWGMFVMKFACPSDSTTVTAMANCLGYTIGDVTYTTTGIHTGILHNRKGCDSVITLDLTIELPQPVITVDVDTLSTTQSYVTYQWMKNGVVIPGATQRKYTVTENADYQVIVTEESGCADTSAVYKVTNHGNGTSIDELSRLAAAIEVYPNPAAQMVYIKSPGTVSIRVCSIDGKMLLSSAAKAFSIDRLANGLYFLNIYDAGGRLVKVQKLIVDKQAR
ncbi:T9SS type A sorting domain-containing protein [Taibaiella koreensis]|uniref:T9SS type A sorting domain-containing protein n=1 Tax=Taibaiella koreensis TaxID=1268548 RepID=UPI000E59942A|nr:T9SS type A sorting domain-containing protein [Taibaiella koreensis]